MGGFGSGQYKHGKAKSCTAELPSFDVRYWKRRGYLVPDQHLRFQWTLRERANFLISVHVESDRITLHYLHRDHDQEWWNRADKVYLDWTNCHLGGTRPWFICPSPRCEKRVTHLYFRKIFACRHCHNLTYYSQKETELDRVARQLDRTREKLKWKPGFLNRNGYKPIGMHLSTFQTLKDRHQKLKHRWLLLVNKKLNLVDLGSS